MTAKCDRCSVRSTIVDVGSALGFVQKFIDQVNALSKDASMEVTYGELYRALETYNILSDDEKESVKESYNVLQMQIKTYNNKADTSNSELAKASELSFAVMASSGFAFLAALWLLLKKKFLV